MSEERPQAPMAKPSETGATPRAASAVPPPREDREGPGGRRRMALRIPDDEISRPQLPDRPSAPSAPSMDTPPNAGPPAAMVTPTRIITISEPPPSVDHAAERTPVDEMAPVRAAAWKNGSPASHGGAGDDAQAAFDGEEVEVRFDDDAPIAPPPAAPPPTRSPPPASASAPKSEASLTDAGWPDPTSVVAAPPTEPVQASRAVERRSTPSDVPEISADDLVTLEPPPVRPASALPPMRPRALSQPGGPPPPALSKPPPIPTPRPPLVIVPPQLGNMPAANADASSARRKARLWWEELFNDDYLRAAEKVVDEQTQREVTFIEESLGVERGGALLDLACGTGRHAIELARRGYEVVGFDLSLAMLARAGDDAQDSGAKLNFVQGDMREMTFEEQFDGVYCWSTSFGYFEEDKNALVVDRVRRALKSGGTFLLDVVNRDFLIRQSPSLAWFEGDGCVCMDEMSVDFITSRMKVKRTMMLDDGRSKEIEYSMRVYSLHELGRILHEHGFKVREVSGRIATPGVFFGDESPRTIILAEKK